MLMCLITVINTIENDLPHPFFPDLRLALQIPLCLQGTVPVNILRCFALPLNIRHPAILQSGQGSIFNEW